MSNASKTGVALIIVVVIIVIGLIWAVNTPNQNNLTSNPPDQELENDLAQIDSQLRALDNESRNMDSFNL